MLQAGRALFREGLIEAAREFFDIAVQQVPDSAEAVACVGYAQHRMGDDDAAIATLRRALQLDTDHAEARIYLGNILYDRGEYEAALYHLDRTAPDDHWDELGIWRLVELKKSVYRLATTIRSSPVGRPTGGACGRDGRHRRHAGGDRAEGGRRGAERGPQPARAVRRAAHRSGERSGTRTRTASCATVGNIDGTWEDIVPDDARCERRRLPAVRSSEFMLTEARRGLSVTGVQIPTHDAESFIRGSADAGLLRIVR